jgi:hypothetical protein
LAAIEACASLLVAGPRRVPFANSLSARFGIGDQKISQVHFEREIDAQPTRRRSNLGSPSSFPQFAFVQIWMAPAELKLREHNLYLSEYTS